MLTFLETIIRFLNQNNISYMLSGSVAMSIYILPRATRDFDFIISVKEEDAELFANNFKEGYYCDSSSIKEAIRHKSIFNIIDHASGFKADFVILKNELYRKTEFERRIKSDFFGLPIYIATAEDLLLSKLIWIQEIQSSIQLDDIRNLREIKHLDWNYINGWIRKLNLNTFDII